MILRLKTPLGEEKAPISFTNFSIQRSSQRIILIFFLFLFTMSGCNESELLDYQLLVRSKNSQNKSVVVFVHGFTGAAKSTWGKFPDLILNDQDLDVFDVFLWGYPSKLIGKNPSIHNIGKHFKTELNIRLRHYKRVYLIGHSMGGLIIQSMIVNELMDGHASQLRKIKHVIFFGTPNKGKQIPGTLRMFNQQLYDLHTTSAEVHKIRKEWGKRVHKPEIHPGDENSKHHIPALAVVGLEDQLVRRESAEGNFENVHTVSGDHIKMKEPQDRGDLSYLLVKQILRLDYSEPNSPTKNFPVAQGSSETGPVLEVKINGAKVESDKKTLAEILEEMGNNDRP